MKSRLLACLSVLMLVGVGAAPAVNAAPTTLTPTSVTRTLTPYVVTMTTPKASITLGSRLKVTGTVRGAGAKKVVLYQRIGTRWAAWASARVVKGRYTVYYRPVSAGGHLIRVYAPTTRWHRARVSVSKAVTVYKWNYLSDFATTSRLVDSSNWDSSGGVANINGQSYIHTPQTRYLYDGATGYVDYNLSRACLTFQMVGGLTDESDSAGTAQLEVQTDGVQNWAQTFTLGQAQGASISIRGALRLRLAATLLTSNDYVMPAFGNARVLCRF